jgi:O-methyltransferase involved in polyketide biosynthesis
MPLKASLQWVEVDLPDILAYKEEILAKDTPNCRLERIALDLSNIDRRKDLFVDLNQRASKITVITEGLLIYLAADEVSLLANDLAANQHFQSWILDVVSPGLLKMMQKSAGKALTEVGAPFRFAPPEGPEFFTPSGWFPETVEGLLKVASRFKRPPLFLRLLSKLPENKGAQNDRPWSGVCVLRSRHSSK